MNSKFIKTFLLCVCGVLVCIFGFLLNTDDSPAQKIKKLKEEINKIVEDVFKSKIKEIVKSKTGKAVVEIENISGNTPTSKVFKVTTKDGQNYIFKFINCQYCSTEIKNQKFASTHGFGPKVIEIGEDFIEEFDAYDPWKKYSYSITEFLPSEKITTDKRHDPKLYQSLADLLKRIHSSAKEDITKVRTIFDEFSIVFRRLENRGNISESGAEMHYRIKDFVQKAKLVLESLGSEKTATHNDLNPQNVIYSNGNFTAIDFDNLAIGDPYNDIAYIIFYYCIYPISDDNFAIDRAKKHQNILLEVYFNRDLTDTEQKKLNIMMKLVLLLKLTIDHELYHFMSSKDNQFIYSPNAENTKMKARFHLANAILNQQNIEAELDYNEIEQARILFQD